MMTTSKNVLVSIGSGTDEGYERPAASSVDE